jgi:hypothetical protein
LKSNTEKHDFFSNGKPVYINATSRKYNTVFLTTLISFVDHSSTGTNQNCKVSLAKQRASEPVNGSGQFNQAMSWIDWLVKPPCIAWL